MEQDQDEEDRQAETNLANTAEERRSCPWSSKTSGRTTQCHLLLSFFSSVCWKKESSGKKKCFVVSVDFSDFGCIQTNDRKEDDGECV